jgi:hypothetical protein
VSYGNNEDSALEKREDVQNPMNLFGLQ